MSLTKTSYSMTNGAPSNVVDFGGASSNTTAENKTALQAAITAVNAAGGGVVVVPYDINYGYDRADSTTWPNLSAVTTDILVIDYSKGDTYSAPSQDGMQVRYWSSSTPYDTLGQHDGNGQWIRGGHSPYLAISTDNAGGTGAQLTATVSGGVITGFSVSSGGSGYTYPPYIQINGNAGTGLLAIATISGGAVTGGVIIDGGSGYTPTNGTIATAASPGSAGVEVAKSNLASLFFMQSGNALWSLTNGGVRGGAYTDEQLNDFTISAWGDYAGDTGVGTNVFVIKRTNGAFGFNTSVPTENYEFWAYDGTDCTVKIVAGNSSTSAVPALLLQDVAYPSTYGGFEVRGTGTATPYLQFITNASNVAKLYPTGLVVDGTVAAKTSVWTSGAGSPEGVVTAVVGCLYTRTDGGANTTLYVKESGTGNTGWVAK